MGETLGCARGWGLGLGLRFTPSEGERAPRGFDGGGGSGGGGRCGGTGAPRGTCRAGWDRDLGNIGGRRKLGGGVNGGGLGGNVGVVVVVVVGIITGVFGGSGGTTGWDSRDCGIGCGGGGGWKSR